MNTVSGEKRTLRPEIRLCPRCKADILPQRLRSSSLARNALRGPAKEMVRPSDPAADRVKRRKEQKALRATMRTEGIGAAVKLFLRGTPAPPPSEECDACLAEQRRFTERPDRRNRRAVRPVLPPATNEVAELNFDRHDAA